MQLWQGLRLSACMAAVCMSSLVALAGSPCTNMRLNPPLLRCRPRHVGCLGMAARQPRPSSDVRTTAAGSGLVWVRVPSAAACLQQPQGTRDASHSCGMLSFHC